MICHMVKNNINTSIDKNVNMLLFLMFMSVLVVLSMVDCTWFEQKRFPLAGQQNTKVKKMTHQIDSVCDSLK